MSFGTKDALWGASGNNSNNVDVSHVHERPVALIVPSDFSGVSIKLDASIDGTNYFPVYTVDGAAEYTVTVAASRYVPLDPRVVAAVNFIRLKSSASEAQNRVVKVVLRTIG